MSEEMIKFLLNEDLGSLNESGGVWSYLKRAWGQFDGNLNKEIEEDIENITTQKQKDKVVRDIQGYIDELETAIEIKTPTFGQRAALLGIGIGTAAVATPTWAIGSLAASYKVFSNSYTIQTKAFKTKAAAAIAKFKSLQAKAKAAKIAEK